MLIKFYDQNQLIESVWLSADRNRVSVGNGKGKPVDVVLHNPLVSRHHADFIWEGGALFIIDQHSTNGTFLHNQRLSAQQTVRLQAGDVLSLAQNSGVLAHVSNQTSPSQNNNSFSVLALLDQKGELLIGRSPECDYRLESPTVSRRHCTLKKTAQGIVLKDLGSRNGTYLNGRKIKAEELIGEQDIILIGTYKLSTKKGIKSIKEEAAVRLLNLEKRFAAEKIGFERISIDIPNQAMMGIMGPSGCGKSTLLKTLTGSINATSGQVYFHGLDFVAYYEYIKSHIGYVPQDDIIHKDLTVGQCLYYTAKLRLPELNEKALHQKIDETLRKLNIQDTRDQLVHSLSGGQRKRACIAVELLNDPLILFLDEPTSPLDPQSVEEFLKILKHLSQQGTTIIMVTHKPEDLAYLDKVLFLAKGGLPVYYGDVQNHLSFFGVSRTVDIYTLLSNEANDRVQVLKNRFRNDNQSAGGASSHHALSTKKQIDLLSQTYWLTVRCLKTKLNDRVNTSLLLLQAPIISLLIGLIFNSVTLSVLFLMSVTAVWLGTNNAARELVNEEHIYKRERLFNLNLGAYITSKLLVFLLLGAVQSVLFTGILYLRFKDASVILNHPLPLLLWFLTLTFCSSILGLCISGLAKNNEQVVSTIPLVLIPQIMLAGIVAKVNSLAVEGISYLTFSRWGTEGFAVFQKRVLLENSNKPGNASGLLAAQYHEQYQNNSLFGALTATLQLDLIMVTGISLLLLIVLFISLKRKDTV